MRVVDKNMEVMMKYEDRNEDEVNYPGTENPGDSSWLRLLSCIMPSTM